MRKITALLLSTALCLAACAGGTGTDVQNSGTQAVTGAAADGSTALTGETESAADGEIPISQTAGSLSEEAGTSSAVTEPPPGSAAEETAAAGGPSEDTKEEETTLKFVTFNIRRDVETDGANRFEYRQPLILKKIREEQPDIICFQEVLEEASDWMREEFDGYYVLSCGRNQGLDGEQIAIAYRCDRLSLISLDTFWLSHTPYSPGTRYGASAYARLCMEALFYDMQEKRVIRVFNTHLDHKGELARKNSLIQILTKADNEEFYPDAPVVLAGDFNMTPSSEEMKVMEDWPQYTDLAKSIGGTFHNFGKTSPASKLDYIFVSEGITCSRVERWDEKEGDVWLSDHYPVCALLDF